jgi:hypothetical protein
VTAGKKHSLGFVVPVGVLFWRQMQVIRTESSMEQNALTITFCSARGAVKPQPSQFPAEIVHVDQPKDLLILCCDRWAGMHRKHWRAILAYQYPTSTTIQLLNKPTGGAI